VRSKENLLNRKSYRWKRFSSTLSYKTLT